MSRVLIGLCLLVVSVCTASAAEEKSAAELSLEQENRIETLKEPLYSPFIERYVLDELKQLRIDTNAQKTWVIQQIVDREHAAIDRAVRYSTDTVTYFFYLIAGVSSVLVLVGWNSIRDIKERIHSVADEEISKIVREYEVRLESIESQLNLKTRHIEQNREQIETTNEIQSLWLRAAQESNNSSKIVIYDQILKIRPDDCEALTYKADAVLELGEPQWASNLCHQALQIDPDNSHAFYQLACAHATLEQPDEAVRYLKEVLSRTDSYRQDIIGETALKPLHSLNSFRALLGLDLDVGAT